MSCLRIRISKRLKRSMRDQMAEMTSAQEKQDQAVIGTKAARLTWLWDRNGMISSTNLKWEAFNYSYWFWQCLPNSCQCGMLSMPPDCMAPLPSSILLMPVQEMNDKGADLSHVCMEAQCTHMRRVGERGQQQHRWQLDYIRAPTNTTAEAQFL